MPLLQGDIFKHTSDSGFEFNGAINQDRWIDGLIINHEDPDWSEEFWIRQTS